MVHFKALNVIF